MYHMRGFCVLLLICCAFAGIETLHGEVIMPIGIAALISNFRTLICGASWKNVDGSSNRPHMTTTALAAMTHTIHLADTIVISTPVRHQFPGFPS